MRGAYIAIPLWIIFLATAFPHTAVYWLAYWWMFPIAIVIATIVNTVGISGAALFVPFFMLAFPLIAQPLPVEQSIMLGLITEAFGLSSSAAAFMKFGLVDKKLAITTIKVALPLVIIGSILSFYTPENVLRIIIALMLVAATYLMLNEKRRESKQECIQKKIIGKHHTHAFSGNTTLRDRDGKMYKYCRICGKKQRLGGYSIGAIFQGMAGFGIGEFGILSMVLTKIPIRVAIGTSHMIVATTAILASTIHVIGSPISSTPWNILMMTVPAALLGGQLAPHISTRLKESTLEKLVAVLFLMLSAALLDISIARTI